MNIRCLQDQVLVRQVAKKEKIGSLYVPQGSEQYPNEGTVLAVGPGKFYPGCASRIPPDVAVGDVVLFKRKPGSALIADSREGGPAEFKDLIMLREDDLLVVVLPLASSGWAS